jgi:phosphatidylserine/phosphatidylglycerophosphate/cardiolipin synthase-like enzyme
MKEHPELLFAPLRQAMADRHLDVSILIRSRNNISGHRRDAQELAEMGVHVFSDSLNHAKGVIADSRIGALFSANFDAVHGLTTGVEVGVRLDGQPALLEAERYFAHAVTHSDTEFVMKPNMRELDQRLAAAWRRPWKEGPRLIVKADRQVWESLKVAGREGPVLFLSRKDRPVQLYAGGGHWSISGREVPEARTLEMLEPPNTTNGNTTRDLLDEWLNSRINDDATRGFCSSVLELDESP